MDKRDALISVLNRLPKERIYDICRKFTALIVETGDFKGRAVVDVTEVKEAATDFKNHLADITMRCPDFSYCHKIALFFQRAAKSDTEHAIYYTALALSYQNNPSLNYLIEAFDYSENEAKEALKAILKEMSPLEKTVYDLESL